MRLAVIVVTFNRKSHLKKTVERLLAEGLVQRDIIVINNNSSDGTSEMMESLFPNVQLVNLDNNIASAGGFAKGMEIAHRQGYDWILLFNDDSRPTKGSLDLALEHIEANPEIDMLKIANLNDEGKAILLNWKGVRVPKYVDQSNIPVRTDLVTFDGCFISKKTMDTIGYCDPQYFMGTYEFDYCLKAKDAGLGIYTLPNGLIEDEKLGSFAGTPPWRQYYNTRNHLRLALHRRSWKIFFGWLKREAKYTGAILLNGNKKGERLMFKYRAVRDAIMGKRGKVYTADFSKSNKASI